MKRISKAFIAVATLGVVGWYGVHTLAPATDFPIGIGILGGRAEALPISPDDWRGRVDYAALDRQLTDLAARPEMAGLAVAVVEQGELRFVRTYGVADRSTAAPVTPATVFRWASVSKTVTGMLAASLASENTIDLTLPIANWQNSLRLPGGAEAQVTLEQLLSQRTGLTKNAYDEKLEEGKSPAVIRAELAAAPLQCQPGTCYTYQNVAFDAASEILGQTTDRNFPDAASERFFLPLGMKSATYGMKGLTGSKDWARPHNGPAVRVLKESYWRVPAAAGVNSNIVDFARWMQATMGGRSDVLPLSVLRVAQMPRVNTPRSYGGELARANSDGAYGLGWRSFTYEGRRLIGHSGGVDGYRATMIFDPATRTGIVAMWNSNWGRPFRIPFAVFDSYHKLPESLWLDLSDLEPASAPSPEEIP